MAIVDFSNNTLLYNISKHDDQFYHKIDIQPLEMAYAYLVSVEEDLKNHLIA